MDDPNRKQNLGKKRFLKLELEEEPEIQSSKTVTVTYPINLKKRIKLGQEPQLTIKLERMDIYSFVLPPSEVNRRKDSNIKMASIDTAYSLKPKMDEQWRSCSKNLFGFSEHMEMEGKEEGKENVKENVPSSSCAPLGIRTFKLKQYCRKCDRIFPGPEHLFKSHLLVHKYLMPYECKIKNCVASFQHKDEYDTHIAEHRKLFEFGCEQCEKRFTRKCTLKMHSIREHNESPQAKFYKCPQCTMGFLNRSTLARHESSHSTLKEFTCNICSMEFKTRPGFERHVSAHYDIRPFRCSKCTKRFTCSALLECHYSIHHNPAKRFKCHICGTQLRYKASLRQHLEKNVCLAREKPFKCTECEGEFRTKGGRRTHLVNIHGYTPLWKKTPTAELEFKYACPDCDEVFQSVRKRIAHRIEAHGYVSKPKQHSPARTYQCPFPDCTRSYTRKAYLANHYRKQHGGENLEARKYRNIPSRFNYTQKKRLSGF